MGVLNNSPINGYITLLQPRYVIKTKTCKRYSILRGYNKRYIYKLSKKTTTNPDKMDIKDKIFLNVMNWQAEENIEYNTIGESKTRNSNTPGYYIV